MVDRDGSGGGGGGGGFQCLRYDKISFEGISPVMVSLCIAVSQYLFLI